MKPSDYRSLHNIAMHLQTIADAIHPSRYPQGGEAYLELSKAAGHIRKAQALARDNFACLVDFSEPCCGSCSHLISNCETLLHEHAEKVEDAGSEVLGTYTHTAHKRYICNGGRNSFSGTHPLNTPCKYYAQKTEAAK